MSKFEVGDKVYSAKWHSTGVVVEPREFISAIGYLQVLHDEDSPEMAGEEGIYEEEELEHRVAI